MKRFLVLFVFVASLSAKDNFGASGFTFLKLPSGSARLAGLGGNGVSLLNGADSFSINPAGVGFSEMRELSFSVIGWFEDYNGKYISYVEPHGTNVWGIGFGYYSTEDFDIRDEDGITINSKDVKFKNMIGSFVLAKSLFMERFALGVSGKYIYEDRYLTKDRKFVWDGGAILKLSRRIYLGFSKQNISGDEKKVVQITRYGGSLVLSRYLLVTVDKKKYSDSETKTGFGCEFSLPEELLQYGRFVLRFGYNDTGSYGRNYDDSTLDKLGLSQTSGWSFGIGVYSSQALGKSYSLEYSLTPYGELGKTTQLTFKYRF
jgi:hypothetical protein